VASACSERSEQLDEQRMLVGAPAAIVTTLPERSDALPVGTDDISDQ
jgi:hypothetical protein